MKLEGVFIALFSCSIIMTNIQHSMINLGEKVSQICAQRFPSGPLHFVQRSLQCVPQLVPFKQLLLHFVSAVAGNHPVATRSFGAVAAYNPSVVGHVLLFSSTFPKRTATGSTVVGGQQSLAELQQTAGRLEYSRFPSSTFYYLFRLYFTHFSQNISKYQNR